MNPLFRRYGIPLLVSAVLHAGAALFGSQSTPVNGVWLSPRAAAQARADELEKKIEAVRTEKAAFINTVVDDVQDGTLESMPFSEFFFRSEVYEAGLKNPVVLERLPDLRQTYGQHREAFRGSLTSGDVDLTDDFTAKRPEKRFGDPINDYGRLIDLLQETGYNCMARTKFHVALEHDLANNPDFRVKFVDNHVGLVSDPKLNNKGIIAPPEILVASYLLSQGIPLWLLPKGLAALYQRGVVGKDSFLKTTGIGEDLPPTGELVDEPIIMGVRWPEADPKEGKTRPSIRAQLQLYEQLAYGVLEFYDNGMMRPVSIPKSVDWCWVTVSFYWDYLIGYDPLSGTEGLPIRAPFEQLCYATQIPAQWKGMNLAGLFEEQKKRIHRACRLQIMEGAFDDLEEECYLWYTYYDRLPDADLDQLVKRYKKGGYVDSPYLFFEPSDPRLKEMANDAVSSGNVENALEIFFYSAKSVNTPFTMADFVAAYTGYVSKRNDEKIVLSRSALSVQELFGRAKLPLIETVGRYLLQRAAQFGEQEVREVTLDVADLDDEALVPVLAKHLEQERAFILQHPLLPPNHGSMSLAHAFIRHTPLLIRHPEILGVSVEDHPHTGNHSPYAHTYLSFQRYFQGVYLLFPPKGVLSNSSFRAYLNNLGSEEVDSYVHDALIREGFARVE